VQTNPLFEVPYQLRFSNIESLAGSIADVTVSDLKRLADRKPLPLENDELLTRNAVKHLAACKNLSTFLSQSVDDDRMKQRSTLHRVYNPD
jgi:hypothetical protein